MPKIANGDDGKILEVSEVAVRNIKKFLKESDTPSAGLRILVEQDDCGCLNYQLYLEDNPNDDDAIIEENGLKIFVDQDSVKMLRGAKMGFTETPEGGGFTFNNPNEQHTH